MCSSNRFGRRRQQQQLQLQYDRYIEGWYMQRGIKAGEAGSVLSVISWKHVWNMVVTLLWAHIIWAIGSCWELSYLASKSQIIKSCHFEFQNQNSDAEVVISQSGFYFSLTTNDHIEPANCFNY